MISEIIDLLRTFIGATTDMLNNLDGVKQTTLDFINGINIQLGFTSLGFMFDTIILMVALSTFFIIVDLARDLV